jgi:hypothetical protein
VELFFHEHTVVSKWKAPAATFAMVNHQMNDNHPEHELVPVVNRETPLNAHVAVRSF